MKNDYTPAEIMSFEMPIYDGKEPVENLLPNSTARSIYNNLLQQQVRRDKRVLNELTHWMTIEFVIKAFIISEYMKQQRIEDIKEGIKQFKAFQHQQLDALSMQNVESTGLGIQ